MSEEETLKHFPEGEIGEIFEAIVSDMEGDGIDFKEEVGFFQVEIPSRSDLSFTVYVVDKKTEDMFTNAEGLY